MHLHLALKLLFSETTLITIIQNLTIAKQVNAICLDEADITFQIYTIFQTYRNKLYSERESANSLRNQFGYNAISNLFGRSSAHIQQSVLWVFLMKLF